MVVSIELDTPAVTQQQVGQIEAVVNEKIRQQVPVAPQLYADKDDPLLAQVAVTLSEKWTKLVMWLAVWLVISQLVWLVGQLTG